MACLRTSILSYAQQSILPLCLAAPPLAVTVHAEESLRLEEVLVTARRKVESLQSAPISVMVLDGEKLQRYGIQSVEDVSALAGGGVMMSREGTQPSLSIRGISADTTNPGFAQSVGLEVDNVFYDRAEFIIPSYLDIGSVEILKGPQAMYFGKSTVAGAIVIHTNDPTPEFESNIAVGHEFSAKQDYVEAVVSGPLLDNLNGRLALKWSESDYQYFPNRDQWQVASRRGA